MFSLTTFRLRGRRPGIMALASLLLIIPWTAQATIMRFLEIEDLTRLSTDIVRGQVISTTTYWNAEHTRIYTAVRVLVKEALKGSIGTGEIITITQLGGEKDGVLLDFAGRPEFTIGENVVLFTTRWRQDYIIVALKQGKMRVEGQEVVRDFSGLSLLDRESRGRRLQAAPARPMRLPLDEVRRRIANTR